MKNRSKFHRSLGILIASSLAAGALATAQDEENAGRPDRMLRLLPLGDPPPWEETNDGVRRIEKDPPPGSVPPQEVVQMTADGAEKGDPIRLRLGSMTPGIPVAGESVMLFDIENLGVGVPPWCSFSMPPGKSHALAILWRDFTEKKWTKPTAMVLPEDLTSFPPGALRFVNVSPYTAEFSINGQAVKLEKNKHATVRPRAAFRRLPLIVNLIAPNGAKMKIADEEINQTDAERTTIVVYFTDGELKRTPAKVKVVLENTRVLPQLPRR